MDHKQDPHTRRGIWQSPIIYSVLIAILCVAVAGGIIALRATKNNDADTGDSSRITPYDSPTITGTATIQTCQFPTDQPCGTCYCLKTENTCEIIDGSAVGDLASFVNAPVAYEANKLPGCSSACNCTIRLLKITKQ